MLPALIFPQAVESALAGNPKAVEDLERAAASERPETRQTRIAASLAQIGEFSFILAELGMALRLLSAEGQSLIVAGALISIALNSFLVRAAAAGWKVVERDVGYGPRTGGKSKVSGSARGSLVAAVDFWRAIS